MKKIIIAKFVNISVVLFLILTCFVVLFYKTEDTNKPLDYSEKDVLTEEISKKEGIFNVEIRETPKSGVTYTCPEGYKLEGTTCMITIEPTKSCINGMEEYAGGGLAGCIRPNSGSSGVKGECLDGQAKKKDQCFELYSYTYSCPEGYNYKNRSCIRVIDATQS